MVHHWTKEEQVALLLLRFVFKTSRSQSKSLKRNAARSSPSKCVKKELPIRAIVQIFNRHFDLAGEDFVHEQKATQQINNLINSMSASAYGLRQRFAPGGRILPAEWMPTCQQLQETAKNLNIATRLNWTHKMKRNRSVQAPRVPEILRAEQHHEDSELARHRCQVQRFLFRFFDTESQGINGREGFQAGKCVQAEPPSRFSEDAKTSLATHLNRDPESSPWISCTSSILFAFHRALLSNAVQRGFVAVIDGTKIEQETHRYPKILSVGSLRSQSCGVDLKLNAEARSYNNMKEFLVWQSIPGDAIIGIFSIAELALAENFEEIAWHLSIPAILGSHNSRGPRGYHQRIKECGRELDCATGRAVGQLIRLARIEPRYVEDLAVLIAGNWKWSEDLPRAEKREREQRYLASVVAGFGSDGDYQQTQTPDTYMSQTQLTSSSDSEYLGGPVTSSQTSSDLPEIIDLVSDSEDEVLEELIDEDFGHSSQTLNDSEVIDDAMQLSDEDEDREARQMLQRQFLQTFVYRHEDDDEWDLCGMLAEIMSVPEPSQI